MVSYFFKRLYNFALIFFSLKYFPKACTCKSKVYFQNPFNLINFGILLVK